MATARALTADISKRMIKEAAANKAAKRLKLSQEENVKASSIKCQSHQTKRADEKSTTSAGKKPFQFRKRLLHEPPEGKDLEWDYIDYACYDDVQKEFKRVAEEDIPKDKQAELDWMTNWLDLWTEQELLNGYMSWVEKQEMVGRLNDKEKKFYAWLFENIVKDWQGVLDETEENDEMYGKDEDFAGNLWQIMDTMRTKARELGCKRPKLALKKAREVNKA